MLLICLTGRWKIPPAGAKLRRRGRGHHLLQVQRRRRVDSGKEEVRGVILSVHAWWMPECVLNGFYIFCYCTSLVKYKWFEHHLELIKVLIRKWKWSDIPAKILLFLPFLHGSMYLNKSSNATYFDDILTDSIISRWAITAKLFQLSKYWLSTDKMTQLEHSQDFLNLDKAQMNYSLGTYFWSFALSHQTSR